MTKDRQTCRSYAPGARASVVLRADEAATRLNILNIRRSQGDRLQAIAASARAAARLNIVNIRGSRDSMKAHNA